MLVHGFLYSIGKKLAVSWRVESIFKNSKEYQLGNLIVLNLDISCFQSLSTEDKSTDSSGASWSIPLKTFISCSLGKLKFHLYVDKQIENIMLVALPKFHVLFHFSVHRN